MKRQVALSDHVAVQVPVARARCAAIGIHGLAGGPEQSGAVVGTAAGQRGGRRSSQQVGAVEHQAQAAQVRPGPNV